MIQVNRVKRVFIAHFGLHRLVGHTTFNLKSQFISIREFPGASQGPLLSSQPSHCKVGLYKQEIGRETEIAWVLDKLSRNSTVGLPYLHMANRNMRENHQEVNHGRESLYYRARPQDSIRLEGRGRAMHILHLLSLGDQRLCFCSAKILECKVLARTFLDINGLIEPLNPKQYSQSSICGLCICRVS